MATVLTAVSLLEAVYTYIVEDDVAISPSMEGYSYYPFCVACDSDECPEISAHRAAEHLEHFDKEDFVGSSSEPLDEAIILAHEYGHHRSFLRNKGGWRELHEKHVKLLEHKASVGDQSCVLAEEELAWEYARPVLQQLCDESVWSGRFSELRAEGLEGYRRAPVVP